MQENLRARPTLFFFYSVYMIEDSPQQMHVTDPDVCLEKCNSPYAVHVITGTQVI